MNLVIKVYYNFELGYAYILLSKLELTGFKVWAPIKSLSI
jgi:hypothetical protein